jgi:hypothetical protein
MAIIFACASWRVAGGDAGNSPHRRPSCGTPRRLRALRQPGSLVAPRWRPIRAVATIASSLGEDAYLFLSDDADHFLAEAALAAIAGALLSSFLKGFTEAAQERSEQWGKGLATFLADRVDKGLERVREKGEPAADAEAAVTDTRAVAQGATAAQATLWSTTSEHALAGALEGCELTPRAAERAASTARHAGLELIGWGE